MWGTSRGWYPRFMAVPAKTEPRRGLLGVVPAPVLSPGLVASTHTGVRWTAAPGVLEPGPLGKGPRQPQRLVPLGLHSAPHMPPAQPGAYCECVQGLG